VQVTELGLLEVKLVAGASFQLELLSIGAILGPVTGKTVWEGYII